jgi:flagellar protein FlbT
MTGDLYRALKDARKLIAYEDKLREQFEATHPKDEVKDEVKADVSSAA